MPKKAKSKIGGIIVIAVIAVVAIALNILLNTFSSFADLYIGRGKAIVTQAEGTESWPSMYYESDYADTASLQAAADALVEAIEAEGIVLMKNNGSLPLASSGARITVLGRDAADPIYGGSGSGSVDLSSVVDLKTALTERGFVLNEVVFSELEEFAAFKMANGSRDYENPRANIVMDRPGASTYSIGEMPVDQYSSSAVASFADYNDAAIVVLGRGGGEGGDLSQDIKGYDVNYVTGQHQLELNQDEKDLLELAKANFDTVVVVINSSSAMELGILENDPEIDSVLWIGSPGQTGLYAVADVLNGTVNPSGRTVDLYAADFTADPTFVNFGDFKYRNVHGGNALDTGYFVQYEEGIYYGYRYYETAAVEGFIDYDEAVVYPFGHGLSYTSFAWEVVGQELGDVDGRIVVQVQVTNTGDVAGKDVVQMYVAAPYYEGGIEKASVVLADFDKTSLLAPGESEVLALSVAVEDMASYDYMGEKAYVLEAGDYGIRIQNDSHNMKEGVEEITYTVNSTIVYSGNNHRVSDLTEVTNQFDDMSAMFTEEREEGFITLMSRADFAGTFPTEPDGDDFKASDATIEDFQPWDTEAYLDDKARMPTTKAENGLSLIAMRGRDFNDPAWEALLDQMDPAGVADIVLSGAYNTAPLDKMGKPATIDLDGPAGISSFMGDDIHGTAYPSEVVIASTYSRELAREMGRMVGNEGLALGVNGWYAPAMNIHRSPFAGRNFEYYSEDPVLSGILGIEVVEGSAEKGVYTFIKHFVLNDQETNRNNDAGVATWANEQAMREIYLKPFEIVVKNAEVEISYIGDDEGTLMTKTMPATTALMSSFNRIGGVWAGGSIPLMQTVLRDEWGFTGVTISDFNLYGYMFPDEGLRAGTDFNIALKGTKSLDDDSSATAVTYLRRTAHRLLYTVAHSNAMNGLVPGTSISYTTAPWRIGLVVFDVLIAALLAFLIFRLIKKNA